MAVLEVSDLRVYFRTTKGPSKAVDGVSFAIEEGDYLGLVGESGCGKSTIAKAILSILPPNGEIAGGSVRFRGRVLNTLSNRELNEIRWKEISLVPQSAMHSFDPVYRIEQQLFEAYAAHERAATRTIQARIEELFKMVGLDPVRLKDFPHQFSGGMRQRAMIAMALVLDPALIIADEPTTGLDVIVQDQILVRLKEIHERLRKTMLLITHDLAVVAENCNRIAVMYAGKLMEYGDRSVFLKPQHPYTLGLVNAFPSIAEDVRELISIPGAPPDLIHPPPGCRFHERCPFATERCSAEEPALREVGPGHVSACHHLERIEEFRVAARDAATWASA
jgi:peptide/nickel transport system ATP-binding protein